MCYKEDEIYKSDEVRGKLRRTQDMTKEVRRKLKALNKCCCLTEYINKNLLSYLYFPEAVEFIFTLITEIDISGRWLAHGCGRAGAASLLPCVGARRQQQLLRGISSPTILAELIVILQRKENHLKLKPIFSCELSSLIRKKM